MKEEGEKSIISTKKKTSIEDLPKVILLEIMKYEGVTEALALVSKRFHALSYDKSVARTISIDSQEKLQEILKPRTLPSLPSIDICLPDQFTVEDLKNTFSIHPNLLELSLDRVSIGEEGGTVIGNFLKSNKTLVSLKLDLNECEKGKEGIIPILESLETSKILRIFELVHRNVGKKEAEIIGRILEKNKKLEQLVLAMCNIGEEGIITIFKSVSKNSTLKELVLGGNAISEKGGIAIGEMLKMNSCLKELTLEGCNIDDKGAITIGESLKTNTTLEKLELERGLMGEGGIAEEGGAAIGKSLETNTTLKILSLLGHPIGEKGGIAIGEMLKINSTLEELSIPWCKIGKKGGIAIGKSLETNNNLKELYLSNNPLGEKGILAVSKGFKNNKSLKALDLGRIKICDEGVKIIGEALKTNLILEELYLGDDEVEIIGEESDIAFSKGLEDNKTLKALNLRGCTLYISSESIFEKFLEKNPTFRIWEGDFAEEDKIVSEAKKNNLTFIIKPHKPNYVDYNDVEEEDASSEGVGNFFDEQEEN